MVAGFHREFESGGSSKAIYFWIQRPAIEVAQQIAAADPIQASEQTLRHRLRERGWLASVDSGRQMVQVRRTLEGISRQVLHLKATALARLSGASAITDTANHFIGMSGLSGFSLAARAHTNHRHASPVAQNLTCILVASERPSVVTAATAV